MDQHIDIEITIEKFFDRYYVLSNEELTSDQEYQAIIEQGITDEVSRLESDYSVAQYLGFQYCRIYEIVKVFHSHPL